MIGPQPWYKRPILPAWVPGWLAASLLIAFAFAAAFGYFLDTESPLVTAAVAGALGFGIALALFSVVAAKDRSGKPNHLAPPAVIWQPIVTGLIVFFPVFWVSHRQIRLPSHQGLAPTLLEGNAAEVIGLSAFLAFVAGGFCSLLDRRPPRRHVGFRLLSLSVAALRIRGVSRARFHE